VRSGTFRDDDEGLDESGSGIYTCPMLCTLVLNGVVSALRALRRRRDGSHGRHLQLRFRRHAAAAKNKEAARRVSTTGRRGRLALSHGRRGVDRRALRGDLHAGPDGTRPTGNTRTQAESCCSRREGCETRYFFGSEFPPHDLRLGIVAGFQPVMPTYQGLVFEET
jgi:hypothetical protein